jgi:predicted DNA-binding transcriptional regulator YafY
MNKYEREYCKTRILKLADLKCTGTPAELGQRLDISSRTVKRMVMEMRAAGNDIRFSPLRKSYIRKRL